MDLQLIIRNLAETVGEESLRTISETRQLKICWGTAPTGKIHIGYYIPLLKIADLVDAGCSVTILVADIHAMLDSRKYSEKRIKNRSDYYIKTLQCMLQQLKVDMASVKIVLGSSFQMTPDYTRDMYKLSTMSLVRDTRNTMAEVVNQGKNPMVSGTLYPIMQALDEQYLQVDAQLGGIDQRRIFMFAREFLPKLGYQKRAHLMTPMVCGLRTNKMKREIHIIKDKMSSSVKKSKLDMLDTRKEIKQKIAAAYCADGDAEDNSVLEILGCVLFPLLERVGKQFNIFRREEEGGPITFDTFDEIVEMYAAGELRAENLKNGVVHWLDIFIEPVRKEFESRTWKQILKHAYE